MNWFNAYPYEEYQCYLTDEADIQEIGMAQDVDWPTDFDTEAPVTTYSFNVNDYQGDCDEYSEECDQYYEELDYGDLFYDENLYSVCGFDWYELECDVNMINNKKVISVQEKHADIATLFAVREETRGKLIVLPQRIPDRFTEDFTTTCTIKA